MAVLAPLAVLAALAAVVVWHMRRPPERPVAVSMARFLPQLAPAEAPSRRLAPAAPLRSLPFWLRVGALGLVALALLPSGLVLPAPPAEGVRLRLVLDVSDGMRLPLAPGGGETRIAAARAVAMAALARAAEGPGACVEVLTVARRAVLEPGPPEAAIARAAPRPEGGGPEALVAAATAPSAACPPGVVLVVTDLPRPAGAGGLLWHQLGAPLPNLGIRAVRLRPAGFDAAAALEIEVAVSEAAPGTAPPVRVIVEGPDGPREAAARGAFEGLYRLSLPLVAPGRHVVRLVAGGAYDADDRVAFDVAAPAAGPALDWREPALPPPPGAPTGRAGAGLVVGPLAALEGEALAGRVLATYPGWGEGAAQGGGARAEIGAFLDEPALLGAVNLDVLEARLPRPLDAPLPAGFAPVLTDAAGGVIVARRAAPAGLILPAPRPDAPDEDIRNLSLTLFYAGLVELAQPAPVALSLEWTGADGRAVPEAWREGDTARPPGPPADLAAIAPAAGPGGELPLWPWLVAAALVLLAAERALGLAWGREDRGAV